MRVREARLARALFRRVSRGSRTGGPPYRSPTRVRWHVIRQSLTQMGQLLVVTSFPLHQLAPDKNCSARTAIEQMPPDGAFLYMFEYAKSHPRLRARFPARPRLFRLRKKTLKPYECMGLSYMVLFRDRRRAFQAHVYLGKRATKRTRARVLEILVVGPAPTKPGGLLVCE
jgi:hypothetical protein